jgi:hypothetical protein
MGAAAGHYHFLFAGTPTFHTETLPPSRTLTTSVALLELQNAKLTEVQAGVAELGINIMLEVRELAMGSGRQYAA